MSASWEKKWRHLGRTSPTLTWICLSNTEATDSQRLAFSVERISSDGLENRPLPTSGAISQLHKTITKELENPSAVSTCAYPRGGFTIPARLYENKHAMKHCPDLSGPLRRFSTIYPIYVYMSIQYPMDLIFHIHHPQFDLIVQNLNNG